MSDKVVVFFGVAAGTFIFLLTALLWAGSPVQDVIISAHGNLINKPGSKLTIDQMLALSDLVSAGAVLPAESLLQKITDFYGTIINLLISIWAALGLIAYMYIKTQSEDFARKEATKAVTDLVAVKFESASFASDLSHICVNQFDAAMQEFATDHSSSLEAFEGWQKDTENKFISLEKRLTSIERLISKADDEEFEGQDLDLE